MKKLLILPFIIFILTGCYDYRELNDLAIVSAISIDYKDDNFLLTAQVVNPKKQQDTSSANEPEFIIYEGYGKTIQEAFRDILNTSPHRMYTSHMQILIISEEIAKTKLPTILDFFSRDAETRSEYNILIAKNNTAKESLSITTPLINLSATNILTAIESNTENIGISVKKTFNELLNDYLNPYTEIIIPSIEIINNNDDKEDAENKKNIENTDANTIYKLSTLSIFKNNKLIDYLDRNDSIGINIILQNAKQTIINHKCNNNEYYTAEILNIKTNKKADVKNKKVTFEIKGHSILSEINCNINIKNPKVIDELEKEINKEVKSLITNSIKTVQKNYKTDVLGIRDLFYKTDANYYKNKYQNWYEDIYKDIEFDIITNFKLYEKGETLGGLFYEKNKN